MFTRDIRSSENLRQHYVDGYADQRQMDGQRVNATVNRQVLRQFRIGLSGKSLLDVGSGYGMFLSDASKSGAHRVVGVELSKVERSFSANVLGLESHDDLHKLSEGDQFDIVTLFEVIEHISDPHEFLASATKRLKPGGSLIIGTDNFTCDVVRCLGDQFPKWIPHEHISLFNPGTLRTVIERVQGLHIVGLRSFTPWELRARQMVFKATGGRRGGRRFNLQAEETAGASRQYRHFALRRACNSIWFNLTSRQDLSGEMMFVHALKG